MPAFQSLENKKLIFLDFFSKIAEHLFYMSVYVLVHSNVPDVQCRVQPLPEGCVEVYELLFERVMQYTDFCIS